MKQYIALQINNLLTDKKLLLVSLVLVTLLIFKSLDFLFSVFGLLVGLGMGFLSETEMVINLEGYLPMLRIATFVITIFLALLVAWGIIMKRRWIKIPLYLILITNFFLFIYSTFIIPSLKTAVLSFLITIILSYYLYLTRQINQGWRLVGTQIILTLIFLPGTMLAILNVLFQDEPLLDDSAMTVEEVQLIKDSENIYTTLTRLGNEIPNGEERERLLTNYPSQWNQPSAEKLLQALQPYVDNFLVSAKQDKYQCPTSVNDFSLQAEPCNLKLIRDYAKLMKFAIIVEAERGNYGKVEEYIVLMFRAGKTIAQSPNINTIEYSMGLVNLIIGLETIDVLAERGLVDRDSLTSSIKEFTISTNSLATPLRREYTLLKTAQEEIKKQTPRTSYIYHPNRTINTLFTVMQKYVEEKVTPCPKDTPYAEPPPNAQVKEIIDNPFRITQPNITGRILLSVALQSIPNLKERTCEINAQIESY